MKKNILLLAALLGAMTWAGCQKAEEDPIEDTPKEEVPTGEKLFLTLQATKTVDTKAMELSNSTLNAYWVDGEEVAVYLEGTYLGLLTADADDVDHTKATLSGDLDAVTGVSHGATLTLLFPRADWDYTGQDGSAPAETGNLATKFDYALATVTVDTVTGNTVTTTGSANFENQQSVYRFGFKIGGTGDAISVSEFTVSSDHNKLVTTRSYSGGAWTSAYGSLTVKPASATNALLYLSVRNENIATSEDDKFSFYVLGGDNVLYVGEKDIPSDRLGNGKFISAQSVSIAKSNLAQTSGTVSEVW